MTEKGSTRAPKLGGRLAHPLRNGAHLTILSGEKRDDAIRFAQLVGAQDDRLVSIGLHHTNIVSCPGTRGGFIQRTSRRAKTSVKCAVTSIDKPTDTR